MLRPNSGDQVVSYYAPCAPIPPWAVIAQSFLGWSARRCTEPNSRYLRWKAVPQSAQNDLSGCLAACSLPRQSPSQSRLCFLGSANLSLKFAATCCAPAPRQVSSRCKKSAHDCQPYLTALFRVELGAVHIAFLDCSSDCAPVVVTVREAVRIT